MGLVGILIMSAVIVYALIELKKYLKEDKE
jgi:hypothetical protein